MYAGLWSKKGRNNAEKKFANRYGDPASPYAASVGAGSRDEVGASMKLLGGNLRKSWLILVSISLPSQAFSPSVFAAEYLRLNAQQVISGAAKMYQQRLQEMALAGSLDGDAAFLKRVQGIAQPLLQQAAHERSASAAWQWEIHTTNDADESSYSMAGGKLLISQTQVLSLELNDAELAMLISHEIQHALLEHNLKEYTEVLRLFPAWSERPFEELEDAVDNDEVLIQALAALGKQQELEADSAGLQLAWRSGFPVASLLNFFKKLTRHSAYPNFESKSHPSSASRWQNARERALSLEKL